MEKGSCITESSPAVRPSVCLQDAQQHAASPHLQRSPPHSRRVGRHHGDGGGRGREHGDAAMSRRGRESGRSGGVLGRGQPSLFTCQDMVIHAAGDRPTYRKSLRFSVSSSSSLTIFGSRPSDAGFYHCRVLLAGLFNDQTTSVHLILIQPRSDVSDSSDGDDDGNLNAPHTPGYITWGSDVTGENSTGPMEPLVQSSVNQQQVNSLQSFLGNTLRVSFIIFIPALLLTAAYGVWRSESNRRSQSEEEENSSV
ncbi:uncharacterized protein LOC129113797 [Anoplopoma fimbria]|uniref:uncharacterized protein LOC129113797 n=1 Tax=Anoplopoma fimbria TaxID=229290 RepID=UPI0023EB8E01|nr:uncharacterized protein LOC129113797 [Anoplopoma fimbria]